MTVTTRTLRCGALAMALVACVGITVPVEAKELTLTGIQNVLIVVEDLNDAATACQLSEVGLRTAVAQPLLDAKIGVDTKTNAMLYVRATTLHLKGMGICVTNLNVNLYAPGTATTGYGQEFIYVSIPLRTYGGIMSESLADHSQQVFMRAKGFAERIATEIRLDNQPSNTPSR